MIDKSVRELNSLIEAREISIADLAEHFITEIQQQNEHYKAIATFSEVGFRMLAESADQLLQSAEPPKSLHGIPILVDDLIDVANMRTTYGCQVFSEHIPDVDSMSVRRCRAFGALFPGKAVTSELGLIVEENADQFVCRSPWGNQIVSGGGSSGSVVGVAKNLAPAAIAMDIGGNVLLPAALNGTFTLLPTYGRIAHTPIYSHGLMFASTALVTRTVADSAYLLNVIAGHSEVDPLSKRMRRADYLTAIDRPISSLSVAVANALWNAPCDKAHQTVIEKIEKVLKSENCRVERNRPPIRDSLEAWKTVVCANLHASHGTTYSKQPDNFGATASEWIERGAATSATDYIDAQKKILGLRLLLREFLAPYDLLIIPAAGCVAFEYGTLPSNLQSADEKSVSWMEYASMCSIGAISGFPVAHLPAGRTKKGMPIGVLVVAKPGDEDLLLTLCATLENKIALQK